MPRLVPERELPPYAFVPGRSPHPVSDPRGHSHGLAPEQAAPPDPKRWRDCLPYLYAIDLFNHGYYWEAHEVWEGLWHACGRRGTTADFLKGLIKLAAAGVKVREGRAEGVRSHARRAAELFGQVARELEGDASYLGLSLRALIDLARQTADQPPLDRGDDGQAVAVVFDWSLQPAQ